ncbi:MAG TPA: tRNA pseudouridine(38-40) synthase TruA [Chitinophagaceae bacterium]|nr:tRNA pseudouridine(38-40) synthase TruA [Chitinophagaceae bacterium]
MKRYFLEVAYHGARYSGFQVQENAATVQSEVERALGIYFRKAIELTGSSRTDAGVHALQNYFHFDAAEEIPAASLYNINAILPRDVVIKSMREVRPNGEGVMPHCRFSALSREYSYYIYQAKNPFLADRAFFYPYTLDISLLELAAAVIPGYTDFSSFSKRRTQVKTFDCNIMVSRWRQVDDCVVYNVKGNRFLRGMVRGLVGTMLQVGRGKIMLEGLREIIEKRDCTLADFAVPAHGLFLTAVEYPENIFV